MTLDKTFQTEIRKAANGDGGKEYKFSLVKELHEISNALGNRYEFNDCIKKYGRAKVALCVAATIMHNTYRFEQQQIAWATLIMNLWTNRAGERSITAACITIHPAILADNSHSLRMLTEMAQL